MKCPKCQHEFNNQPIPPTAKMKKILEFIDSYITINNMSPSYDEIRDGTHLKSKSEVARYIMSLSQRGWVKKEMYGKRTLRVLHKVPMQKKISA
tara:strand:+ start:1389 stop:1670 length:282 start_codon:yes stop_codon:yes gene_type:complete